ncbi:MAG: uracil-DNA glycosylase [Pedobacter sp.]|nr:MAG: uracil-DNA glycosylase [Pedobacter sp.]
MGVSSSWEDFLSQENQQPYMQKIYDFLAHERLSGKLIFPPTENIFKIFELCPLEDIKLVILGQDPYHQIHQAHGLAFSVPSGIKIPPSLANIYKALKNQIPNFQIPNHGDLTEWAQQGVFLLNTSLTVEYSKPGSHSKIGWQTFTNEVIKHISAYQKGIVFLLWGQHAQGKTALIDSTKHLIIKTVHPSPLSAYQGFLSSTQFKEANEYLEKQGKLPINWQLSDTGHTKGTIQMNLF